MEHQKKRVSQRPFTDRKSAGYTLVSALIVMPVAISLLTAFFGLIGSLFYYQKTQHLCRQSLLKTQGSVAKSINQLFRLNPKATTLRKKRRRADKALKAAMKSKNPKIIAAAKAAQLLVIGQQLMLQQQQQKWLNDARVTTLRGKQESRKKLRRALMGVPQIFTRFKPPAVTWAPPRSLTPTYRSHPHLNYQQMFRLRWSLDLNQILGAVWPHGLGLKLPTLRGQCSTTAMERKKFWQPILANAGRLL